MWKAEKIELKKNTAHPNGFYFADCYSLKINDELISNTVKDSFSVGTFNYFQVYVCDNCGIEHCHQGGFLMVRKQGNTLLFLPAFDWMEEGEKIYDPKGIPASEAPPYKMFTEGILVVEGDALVELFKLIPSMAILDIPEVNETYLKLISEWETLVKEKPKGFMPEIVQ